MKREIHVIGAGLAGSEAAWQAASRGIPVVLHEMKPQRRTPAHRTDLFAELVCSNSLRSDSLSNAIGLLKAELRSLGSLIMEAADATKVPAGSALAVDREKFAQYVTDKTRSHPLICIEEGEMDGIAEDAVNVIATGPLTSDALASYISGTLGCGSLHFFDAAAPIVSADSIDMSVAFFASRYDKGDADYLNYPMTKEEYEAFWRELVSAREAELKDFDREEQKDLTVFEGCMPVEIMAKRGPDTLRYGPLKPVGLKDPRTGREPYAVVQLRRENSEGTMYNLVGFQTHLAFPEQRRVFGMIPGLSNAEFLRYGVMHRNTYLNGPEILDATYAMRTDPNIFFAGQMSGVEGYIESCASGFAAGIGALRRVNGQEKYEFPRTTMIGAMAYYVSHGSVGPFVPMNANFGIVPPLDRKVRGGKSVRNEELSRRSLSQMDEIAATINA